MKNVKAWLIATGIVVTAVSCGGIAYAAVTVKGRALYHGYFHNVRDYYGSPVWDEGIPNSVNTASEFKSYVKVRLDSTNAQRRVGAAFIIQTMIGSSKQLPPTPAQIAEWERRIDYYDRMGWIDWHHTQSYRLNSFWQGSGKGSNPRDDAFYLEDKTHTASTIRFGHSGGSNYYLKRACANPVGSIGELEEPRAFNMSGYVTGEDADGNVKKSSSSSSAPNVYVDVAPGDTVYTRAYLHNAGPDTAPKINWSLRKVNVGGDVATGTRSNIQDDATVRVHTERLVIPSTARPGDQFCRDIYYRPNTQNGGNGNSGNLCFRVVVAPPQPVCNGYSTNVPNIDTEARFNLSVSVRYRTAAELQLVRSSNPQMYINLTGPSYANNNPNVRPISYSSLTMSATLQNVGPLSTPGRYTVHYGVTSSAGNISCPPRTITVAAMPYVSVRGGDVVIGAPIVSGDSNNITCSINKNDEAGVVSWNQGVHGSFAGAGTKHAVFAMSHIQEFATGRSAADPSTIAFANTSAVIHLASGVYGGSFDGANDEGGYVGCVPNYYYPQGAAYGGGGLPGATGSFRTAGNVTLNGGAVPDGRRITIYVNGDAYINGNITYDGSYANVSQVPLFVLVAKGNIYIDNDVTQLDGLYVAQPSGSGLGAEGVVYTCATGQGAPVDPFDNNASNALRSSFYNTCNHRLTVHGSIVARQMKLLRTAGTLSGEPAETIQSTPELWVNARYFPRDPSENSGLIGNYDAIVSLPPIL